MWWLRPVPWLRFAAAALLVTLLIATELRDPATERYPFAARDVEAGTAMGDPGVEWRDVPAGLLPPFEPSGATRVAVKGGTPLVPELTAPLRPVPGDWWVIEVPLGAEAAPGTTVRLVILEPAMAVTGVVVTGPRLDSFGGLERGAVAIPPANADVVARAAAGDRVVTLVSAAGVGSGH